MNPAALVLALWFMGAQAIFWVDCCCGSFCLRKDACTGCRDMSMGEGIPMEGHGCRNPAMGMDPSKGCEHVPIILGWVPLIPAGPAAVWAPIHRESKSPPHAEDPPLYLRIQVLLI